MEAIASTAFGIKVDSQKDENSQFIKMGRKAFNRPAFNVAVLIFRKYKLIYFSFC